VQQESRENLAVFVATEIGSGGIGSTSTRSSRRSVTQMFAPLSTIDGVDPEADPAAAQLVVNGAIVQSQWEEVFHRTARVQGKLDGLCRDGNRQWWYWFDIHKEFKEISDADVGTAIHHRWSRPRGQPSRCTVDPSSNACIGIFVTVKAKNLWQANKTCDAVHREPVCVEFIGQERSRVISQREWEFEGSSMRCRTDEDPGVGE